MNLSPPLRGRDRVCIVRQVGERFAGNLELMISTRPRTDLPLARSCSWMSDTFARATKKCLWKRTCLREMFAKENSSYPPYPAWSRTLPTPRWDGGASVSSSGEGTATRKLLTRMRDFLTEERIGVTLYRRRSSRVRVRGNFDQRENYETREYSESPRKDDI